MSRQREGKLAQSIMTSLRRQGVFCFKVHGSEFMAAGLPDIIGCVEGLFIGLEVKLPETRSNTTPRQRLMVTNIRKAGGCAAVVTSVKEARAIVNELLAARP